MPWIQLPSGTPYFVNRLPEGAKEIPAPGSEQTETRERSATGSMPVSKTGDEGSSPSGPAKEESKKK